MENQSKNQFYSNGFCFDITPRLQINNQMEKDNTYGTTDDIIYAPVYLTSVSFEKVTLYHLVKILENMNF